MGSEKRRLQRSKMQIPIAIEPLGDGWLWVATANHGNRRRSAVVG